MPEKILTLFTAPKPFKDSHISVIQGNAIKSWKSLGDEVEILVMGSDEGIAEYCRKLNVTHIPDVKTNELGTPLISSMIDLARENSNSPYLCIVNTDIILFPDLLDALKQIGEVKNKFLIIGQRYDMEIKAALPGDVDSFSGFKQRVLIDGKLHPPMGSDYFIFPRFCYKEVPDLTIGRAGWDNWFIFKSRWERWPVVDATQDIIIVHQNHDYRHLPGGQPHYRLPETKENVERGGGEHTIFTMFDAQFQLRNGKLTRKSLTFRKILREIEIFPLIVLKSVILGKLFFYVFHPRKGYQFLRKRITGSFD